MKDAPLWETAGLLVVLGLMAIPLAALTRDRGEPADEVVVEEPSEHGHVETLVQVRTAHPFQFVEIRRDDEVLGRLEGPATEGELTCRLDGEEDWTSLPNSQNILTCSLTQLNSTPSSLVTSGET